MAERQRLARTEIAVGEELVVCHVRTTDSGYFDGDLQLVRGWRGDESGLQAEIPRPMENRRDDLTRLFRASEM